MPQATKVDNNKVTINGETMYPYMVDGDDGNNTRVLVFSATRPTVGAPSLSLLLGGVNAEKLHCWEVRGQQVWSEAKPKQGVSVDKLRASIASQFKDEGFNTPQLLGFVMSQVGDKLGSLIAKVISNNTISSDTELDPRSLQSISKKVVAEYNTTKTIDNITPNTIADVEKVIGFDRVWKAVAKCCKVQSTEYDKFNATYNQIYSEASKVPLTPKQCETRVTQFINAFAKTGGNINSNLLHSKEYTEAMKLHVSDPENSIKLLNSLQREKPKYHPTELVKAYTTCMRHVQEIKASYPNGQQDKAQTYIGMFIARASSSIVGVNRIGDGFLTTLRDKMVPDSPFITSAAKSREMTDAKFAKDFGTHFPMLKKSLEKIIIDQHPEKFKDSYNQKFVDKQLRRMAGKIADHVQSMPQNGHNVTAHREFAVLEAECTKANLAQGAAGGMLMNILSPLKLTKTPTDLVSIFKEEAYVLEMKEKYPNLYKKIEKAMQYEKNPIKYNKCVANACASIVSRTQELGYDGPDTSLLQSVDDMLSLGYRFEPRDPSPELYFNENGNLIFNPMLVEQAFAYPNKIVEEITNKYPKVIDKITKDLQEKGLEVNINNIAYGIKDLKDELHVRGFVNYTGFRMVNHQLTEPDANIPGVLAKISDALANNKIESLAPPQEIREISKEKLAENQSFIASITKTDNIGGPTR